jgi:hypothetical protein
VSGSPEINSWGFGANNENFFNGSFFNPDTITGSGLITESPDVFIGISPDVITGSGLITENPDVFIGISPDVITGSGLITENPDVFISASQIGEGLNVNSLASEFNVILFDQFTAPRDPSLVVAQRFASAYSNYASNGIVPGVNVAAGGDILLLISAFSSDNTEETVISMSQNIAGFWETVTTTGEPAHGGSEVVSVTVTINEEALRSAINSNVDVPPQTQGWLPMHISIEIILKTAVFVVTELVNGIEVQFNESIT